MSGEQPVNFNELDDNTKRQIAGKCCYNILTILSTAAFICGLWSYMACDFNLRYVTFKDNEATQDVCDRLGFAPPYNTLCQNLGGVHGVGFEGWWVQTDQVCYSYLQLTPSGYQEPPLDTNFNSARALSITGTVLGGAAWLTLMMAACCKLDQYKLKGIACYYFLACLFTGLSLLMFRSNVCTDPGFFEVYFTGEQNSGAGDNIVEKVECKLSTGSKLAISATVLYFVCNSIVPMVLVPEPFWGGPEPQPTPGAPPQYKDNNNEEADA